MEINDLYLVKELENRCGNRYLAVKFLYSAARKLGKKKKEYHISESKLIQWVISGECPYTDAQLELMRRNTDDDCLNETLSWVSDKEVADRVRMLYRESVRNRRLTYCNDKEVSEGRITRINVLLRMIWYSENI